MKSPHLYDKADYHFATVDEAGLSGDHAANHTVVFLRWLIEQHLMSEFFEKECADVLRAFRAGQKSIHQVYDWWDGCLIDDMLSEEGNAFAMNYFDFERGKYINDYKRALQHGLPTEYHIDYNEENYQTMKRIIDRRYLRWKKSKRWWWPF